MVGCRSAAAPFVVTAQTGIGPVTTTEEEAVRFIMFMHPNTDVIGESWDAGPSVEAVAAMTEYNEALTQAGVLLAADGLHPPVEGARVRFEGGTGSVTDGPFAEAKEVVGGYWTIDVKDKAEAVAWATRCPAADGDMIEVRRVYELSDFSEEVQAAAELSATPPEQTSAS